MGNEASKVKTRTKSLKTSENPRNGSVLSADLSANGLDVKGDPIKQNGGPPPLDLQTETKEPDYVIIESDSQKASDVAPVISNVLEAATKAGAVLETSTPEVIEAANNMEKVLETAIETEVVEAANKADEILETAIDAKQDLENAIIGNNVLDTSIKEEVKKVKEIHNPFANFFKKKVMPPVKVEEEVKEETNEDQTAPEESPPTCDPETEWGSSGPEATTVIVREITEEVEFGYLNSKAETSTQTDKIPESDTSTQTGQDDYNMTFTQIPLQVVTETVAIEETLLSGSVVVIGEEAVEETAIEEPLAPGIVVEEEFIMEESVYENVVFRAELVEVMDSITEGENRDEESGPLEVSSSIPEVVAECVQAVFVATVNPPQASFQRDKGEEVADTDLSLIKVSKPESIGFTRVTREAYCISSQKEEPGTLEMEPILAVSCEETYPTPSIRDKPAEDLSRTPVTDNLANVESKYLEIAADAIVAQEEEAGRNEEEKLIPVTEDQPSETHDMNKCVPEEKVIIVAPNNGLITIEELPNETLVSPDIEGEPGSVPEVQTTDPDTDPSEDVIANMEQRTVEEGQSNPVQCDAEVFPEAAIEALSLDFAAITITLQESEVEYSMIWKEEVITATSFMPLLVEEEASLDSQGFPSVTIANEVNEDAIEALAYELDKISESAEEDTPQSEQTAGLLNPISTEKDAATDTTENILDSVVNTVSEKVEVIKNKVDKTVDKQEDAPQTDVIAKSSPCKLQVELVKKTDAPVEVRFEDITEEAVGQDLHVATNSTPLIPAGTTEDILLMPQPKTDGLLVRLEDNIESVVESFSRKLHATGHKMEDNALAEDKADVPQKHANEVSEPFVLIQQDCVDENITPFGEHSEDIKIEKAPLLLVVGECVETTYSNPTEASANLVAQQPKNKGFLVKLENTLESVVEAVSEKFEFIGNKDEEPAEDHMAIKDESEPCVSSEEESEAEQGHIVAESLEDACKGTAASSTMNPIVSEEPKEGSASIFTLQPHTEGLQINFENTLKSDAKAVSEMVENPENTVEKPVDKQVHRLQMDVMEKLKPCFIQPLIEEEGKTTVEALLEDACKERDIQSVDDDESTFPTAAGLAISEVPLNKRPNFFEQKKFENTLESEANSFSKELQLTDNITEQQTHEPADVPQVDSSGESDPCVFVQGDILETIIAPVQMLLDEGSNKTASQSLVCLEPTDSNNVISGETVGNSSGSLEQQPRTKGLMERFEDTIGSMSEDILENLEVRENITLPVGGEEKFLQVDAIDSERCFIVQEELDEVLSKDAQVEEHVASVECIPSTGLNCVLSKECTKETTNLCEKQVQNDELMSENMLEAVLNPQDSAIQQGCVKGGISPFKENYKATAPPPLVAEDSESLVVPQQTKGLVVRPANTSNEAVSEMLKLTGNIHEPADDQTYVHHIGSEAEATSDEALIDFCIDAVLETIVEEIITEDFVTEYEDVTAEKVAEEFTDDRTNENSMCLTLGSQSAENVEDAPATNTDMDALLDRLRSVCTSAVAESGFNLDGFEMSFLGYSITVTICVFPNEEQQ